MKITKYVNTDVNIENTSEKKYAIINHIMVANKIEIENKTNSII